MPDQRLEIDGETISALAARLDSLDRLIAVRFEAVQEATRVATAAMDKRLDAMNEFRDSLRDQNEKFIQKEIYDTQHQAVVDRIDQMNERLYEVEKFIASIQHLKNEKDRGIGSTYQISATIGVVVAVIVSVLTFGFQLLRSAGH